MTIAYNENYKGTMPFSDTCYQFGFAANVEQTVTIPGTNLQQYQALFSYNATANVFVAVNNTVTIPTVGTPGLAPYVEFKPKKRYVKGGDVIHIKTPDTSAYAGFSLRQIQA